MATAILSRRRYRKFRCGTPSTRRRRGTGHSNGGFGALSLATAAPDLTLAVAPLAGMTSLGGGLLATPERRTNLLDTLAVMAHRRFDGDPGVVVGADDARMALVDGAGIVDRVIHHVVVEFFLFDRPVDIVVVDQIAA